MERLTLNSPAKINIGLNIVAKRDDNYHDLETFFYPIYDLADKIIFEKSPNFVFDSNNTELNQDANNLILKAHSFIELETNKKLPIKIRLIKNIPIGAGLGGGSSNAATTLLGLNEFFNLKIETKKLLSIALKLGSDVPFFIHSKPAVGFSRGEILHVSENYIDYPILIVNPGIHISTKEAFKYIAPKKSDFDYNYFLNTDKIDLTYIDKYIKNDFEEYVFNIYQEIRDIKELMKNYGSLFTRMSGTGSTVYGFFKNIADAKSAANNLPQQYFKHISES